MIERLKEMYAISSEGVAGPNEVIDFPITTGHTNTPIVRWKESLNDIWADRGEKINKRNQKLKDIRKLYEYFHDCKDFLNTIIE